MYGPLQKLFKGKDDRIHNNLALFLHLENIKNYWKTRLNRYRSCKHRYF